jgi:hypothetical protein
MDVDIVYVPAAVHVCVLFLIHFFVPVHVHVRVHVIAVVVCMFMFMCDFVMLISTENF